ncbi:MAG: periplasmic heavy metal sensor, partial [Calditrichaeota bacterium]
KAIRLDGMKQTMPLRNKIQELRAQLHTLQTKEAVNLKKVNALIDQIGDLKTQIMKIRAAHRQQIRALLTEEQRIIFDSMPHGQHKPGHQRPFMRKGRMQ